MAKLRVGLIGTGMIATQAHIPAWKALADEAEIVGCADILEDRAKEVAEREGIPNAFGDWEKMLRDMSFDVVVVTTPNAYHAPQSIAALQAGAHVICEKPAAANHEEAVAMYAAAERAGRNLMIGQSARFMLRSRAAKEIIDSGRLGEIYFAETTSMRRRGIPKWGQFHIKKHSIGGPVLDLGVHAIDLLYYLMGNPPLESVSGAAYTKIGNRDEQILTSDADSGAFSGVRSRRVYDWRDFDVEDMAAGFIRLKGGVAIQLKTSWAANIPKNTGETLILGSEAGLVLDPLTLVTNVGSCQANIDAQIPDEPHGWVSGHYRETAHFVRVLQGKEELIVKRDEVLNVMKTLDALYRSAAEGREVRVD